MKNDPAPTENASSLAFSVGAGIYAYTLLNN